MPRTNFDPKRGERSFTLLETMIAMTIMVTVILHVSQAQGDMVYNAGYGRKMTEAMWIARAVMAKVEYYWGYREFKTLESEGKVPKGTGISDLELDEDSDYTYSLSILEWKFPILDLIQGGGSSSSSEEGDSGSTRSTFPIKDMLKRILGDHILKVATVEVSWAEGAKEQSVQLAYLLTNQRKIDEQLGNLTSTYKDMILKVENEGKPPPKNTIECRLKFGEDFIFDGQGKKCKKRVKTTSKKSSAKNPK